VDLRPPQLPARPLTLDDVSDLAAADGTYRYELDEGTLVVIAPPDKGHNAIVSRLQRWLFNHGYTGDEVLAVSGVEIRERTCGRCPDLMVVDGSVPDDAIWIEAAAVRLVVEVVSKGTETQDREVKPGEYAGAGIRHYWRIERGDEPTVHMYGPGIGKHAKPAYTDSEIVPLEKLLAGEPPKL
jgi:Uma2 family endonuclease